MRRRDWLFGATAFGAVAGLEAGAAARSGPRRPDRGRLPARIAFGSCADQDKEQPIWDAINDLQPDLFIFLGDNIYGDTRDPAVLRAKYRKLAQKSGFRRLCRHTPVLAIWDDHDYGEDDSGGDYPMKRESQRIFCDFWSEPPDSLRRTRDGIYDAVRFEAGGRTLQIILPDMRFNRTPLVRAARGRQTVLGPYESQLDPAATMLGAAQWQWLEGVLRQKADVRILASSVQVAADATGWESWICFPRERQRLIETIRAARAEGLFCISGDMHYGELSCMTEGVPYPLWDLTSSGLTEVWPQRPPNRWRVGDILAEMNFGWIEIDWARPDLAVLLQVRDVRGAVRLERRIPLSGLGMADV